MKRISHKLNNEEIKHAFMDYINKVEGLSLTLKDVVGYGMINEGGKQGWVGIITYHKSED